LSVVFSLPLGAGIVRPENMPQNFAFGMQNDFLNAAVAHPQPNLGDCEWAGAESRVVTRPAARQAKYRVKTRKAKIIRALKGGMKRQPARDRCPGVISTLAPAVPLPLTACTPQRQDPLFCGRVLASLEDDGQPIIEDAVNAALSALTARLQRAGSVPTGWCDRAMPKPKRVACELPACDCCELPELELVLAPVYIDGHFVLFVVDRANRILEVHDSWPEGWTRDRIADNVLSHRKAFGLPEILDRIFVDCEQQQAAEPYDSGLQVIQNAAKRLGYVDWQFTRAEVKAMLRAHWSM
jgi:hypothetical protein